MPYYLYIHNIYLYQYHNTKPNPINIDYLLGLTPTETNFYSYVMGLDEELWDILEDGVGDLVLDEEGPAIDRKKHTLEQKKLYKKNHKIRGSLVTATPKAEYMKMSDKSTAKAMFASLCANYEWSKKVKNKSSFACLLV